jgi:hypothetical protein
MAGITKPSGYSLLFALVLFVGGCSAVPANFYSTPKQMEIDGISYTACSGTIWIYSPSRDVASSTEKSYEVTFTDDYGRFEDLKDVKSYTITNEDYATYAMPDPVPGPDDTKYSNGRPFVTGDVVWFGKDGSNGRATFISPGNWKPVPCPK